MWAPCGRSLKTWKWLWAPCGRLVGALRNPTLATGALWAPCGRLVGALGVLHFFAGRLMGALRAPCGRPCGRLAGAPVGALVGALAGALWARGIHERLKVRFRPLEQEWRKLLKSQDTARAMCYITTHKCVPRALYDLDENCLRTQVRSSEKQAVRILSLIWTHVRQCDCKRTNC